MILASLLVEDESVRGRRHGRAKRTLKPPSVMPRSGDASLCFMVLCGCAANSGHVCSFKLTSLVTATPEHTLTIFIIATSLVTTKPKHTATIHITTEMRLREWIIGACQGYQHT